MNSLGTAARQAALEDADSFRACAPALAIDGKSAAGRRVEAPAAKAAPSTQLTIPAQGALGAKGYAAIPGALSGETARALRDAIDALQREGFPATFVYVYDAAWEPLRALTQIAQRELDDFDVLADAWAFRVEPGNHGWNVHRGSYANDGRVMLNAWVALTHATVDASCMHLVPLDRDPNFPGALARVDVPAHGVVALEAEPGTALVWDANTLHWGGEMRASANAAPRMSITFTLRASRAKRADLPVLDLASLDFRARLDLIADQIVKYASHEAVPSDIAEWAKLTIMTRAVAEKMRG